MKTPFLRFLLVVFFLATLSHYLLGYQLLEQTWPANTTVKMQLALGPTDVTLLDGLGTWNSSAADALTLWNQHIDFVKFAWVSGSTAPKGPDDGFNSVLFSDTIFGEGFGDSTLAVTVVWTSDRDATVETEADVIFNNAQSYNSYRGPILPSSYDFHRVALHEFGHVLGLAHAYNNPVGQGLMEPVISNLDHLAADDIAGAVYLYGYRITTPPTNQFYQGEPVTWFIQANNHPTSFSATGLPAGLQLNTATGEITGSALVAGTFAITVTAHGSPRAVSAVITLTLLHASLTSPGIVDGPVGTSLSYTIAAGNSPTSFTATGLPAGLTLNHSTGVISGIPTLSGSYDANLVAHGEQYDTGGMVEFRIFPATRAWAKQIFLANTVIRTVQDPVRDRLYVLTLSDLTVFDTNLLSIIKTIPISNGRDLCLSLDGSKIWVADRNTIHAYSLTDYKALPAIPSGPFSYHQVREGMGNKLYVVDDFPVSGIFEIHLATGAVSPIRLAMPGYTISAQIDLSGDGKYLYAGYNDNDIAREKIERFDISGGSAVLRKTLILSTPNLSALRVSADGKLLTYTTDGDIYGQNETYTVSTSNLTAPATAIEPTSGGGILTFANPSSTAYFSTANQQLHRVLDFVSTGNGVPFREWPVDEPGFTFVDHQGRSLLLCTSYAIDVYPLVTAPSVVPAPRSLLNVSTRSSVGREDERMIAGFIITGDSPKQIALRAIGPSLPVAGALSNPALTLIDETGAVIASNENWNTNRAALLDFGLDPWDEHDAALVATLNPGSYTAVVNIETAAEGVGLIEVYDLSSDSSSKLANLSTRGKVGTDDDVLIGGFIVGGDIATDVIVRAIGPSLASSDVNGVLLDPMLQLYNSNGVQIAANDDWRSDQEGAITATGLPPTKNKESAILSSLPAGAFTAIVRGKNATTGIALIEIYNLDTGSGTAR